jgi:hypothetical protein
MTIAFEKIIDSTTLQQQRDATWQDYVALRDSRTLDWRKIAFYQGWLWAGMGTEELNHAAFSDLMTMIFGFWCSSILNQHCNRLFAQLLEKETDPLTRAIGYLDD